MYTVVRGTDNIRIIVLSEIPKSEHNTLWHLFSGDPETVAFGVKQYQIGTNDVSLVLNQLFDNYQLEGLVMSYTMGNFRQDFLREHLREFYQ